MWSHLTAWLPAACAPGVDPCNDGPSSGHSWLLTVVVVVLVMASVVCVVAAVRYLRGREDA